MPQTLKREQFRTLLKCTKCGADGHAVWEEDGEGFLDGSLGRAVSLSGNFVLRAGKTMEGQKQIACSICGTSHPD